MKHDQHNLVIFYGKENNFSHFHIHKHKRGGQNYFHFHYFKEKFLVKLLQILFYKPTFKNLRRC